MAEAGSRGDTAVATTTAAGLKATIEPLGRDWLVAALAAVAAVLEPATEPPFWSRRFWAQLAAAGNPRAMTGSPSSQPLHLPTALRLAVSSCASDVVVLGGSLARFIWRPTAAATTAQSGARQPPASHYSAQLAASVCPVPSATAVLEWLQRLLTVVEMQTSDKVVLDAVQEIFPAAWTELLSVFDLESATIVDEQQALVRPAAAVTVLNVVIPLSLTRLHSTYPAIAALLNLLKRCELRVYDTSRQRTLLVLSVQYDTRGPAAVKLTVGIQQGQPVWLDAAGNQPFVGDDGAPVPAFPIHELVADVATDVALLGRYLPLAAPTIQARLEGTFPAEGDDPVTSAVGWRLHLTNFKWSSRIMYSAAAVVQLPSLLDCIVATWKAGLLWRRQENGNWRMDMTVQGAVPAKSWGTSLLALAWRTAVAKHVPRELVRLIHRVLRAASADVAGWR